MSIVELVGPNTTMKRRRSGRAHSLVSGHILEIELLETIKE